MAAGGDRNKKGGKGAPKLARSGRNRTKYALQYQRTFRNKLRRVRKHNGEEAAQEYATRRAPTGKSAPTLALPKRVA